MKVRYLYGFYGCTMRSGNFGLKHYTVSWELWGSEANMLGFQRFGRDWLAAMSLKGGPGLFIARV